MNWLKAIIFTVVIGATTGAIGILGLIAFFIITCAYLAKVLYWLGNFMRKQGL